jgi:hypothetical protein
MVPTVVAVITVAQFFAKRSHELIRWFLLGNRRSACRFAAVQKRNKNLTPCAFPLWTLLGKQGDLARRAIERHANKR